MLGQGRLDKCFTYSEVSVMLMRSSSTSHQRQPFCCSGCSRLRRPCAQGELVAGTGCTRCSSPALHHPWVRRRRRPRLVAFVKIYYPSYQIFRQIKYIYFLKTKPGQRKLQTSPWSTAVYSFRKRGTFQLLPSPSIYINIKQNSFIILKRFNHALRTLRWPVRDQKKLKKR